MDQYHNCLWQMNHHDYRRVKLIYYRHHYEPFKMRVIFLINGTESGNVNGTVVIKYIK